MALSPRLVPTSEPDDPTAAVLVLHGGGSRRGNMMVSPTQLSVLRMAPVAKALARAGRGRLGVFRLLNSVRGWDTHHTPVRDVSWAIGRLRDRYGSEMPIGLVGHSLGGRAALLSAAAPGVRSVVALNPFVYLDDVRGMASASRTLIVQGTEDRISRPDRTYAVAAALGRQGDVRLAFVTGGRHAMLRHHRRYTRLATDFTTHVLLGDAVDGFVQDLLTGDDSVLEC